MRARRALGIMLIATAASTCPAAAENELEVRAASTEYRFLDLSRVFESGVVLSALYAGDPEVNDVHVGAGYYFGEDERASLTPIVYYMRGSLGERGVMLGIHGDLALGNWRVLGFAGHFFEDEGESGDFTFVDTLDVTRRFGAWETGVSSDVYWFDGERWSVVGPTLKRHDSLGTWAASYRFGEQDEFRVTRILEF